MLLLRVLAAFMHEHRNRIELLLLIALQHVKETRWLTGNATANNDNRRIEGVSIGWRHLWPGQSALLEMLEASHAEDRCAFINALCFLLTSLTVDKMVDFSK